MGSPAGQLSTAELQHIGLAKLRELGSSFIIGVDEVGLGSLAGPVCVCAAVARADWKHPRVRDSKTMKALCAAVAKEVLQPPNVPFYSVRNHDNLTIDKMGITKARDDLVLQVVQRVRERFEFRDALVVMDGNMLPRGLKNAICFPKADALCSAVSAASILAKADRDDLMRMMHEEYPNYGFDSNAGYNSPVHEAGLAKYGLTPIHRLSYGKLRELYAKPSPNKSRPAKLPTWLQPPKGTPGSTSSSKR